MLGVVRQAAIFKPISTTKSYDSNVSQGFSERISLVVNHSYIPITSMVTDPANIYGSEFKVRSCSPSVTALACHITFYWTWFINGNMSRIRAYHVSVIVPPLTHWGRVTHICVSKLTIFGSDNGLSPRRRQAIIWTNAGILSTGPLGTKVSEILIEIFTFSFKKMHLKMPSGKWRPSCLGLNVLTHHHFPAGCFRLSWDKRYSHIIIVYQMQVHFVGYLVFGMVPSWLNFQSGG